MMGGSGRGGRTRCTWRSTSAGAEAGEVKAQEEKERGRAAAAQLDPLLGVEDVELDLGHREGIHLPKHGGVPTDAKPHLR